MERVLQAELQAEQAGAAAAERPRPVSSRYPISWATVTMCSRVTALTPVAPRIAMETSAVDTPARAATSARVGRFPPGGGGIDGLPFQAVPGPALGRPGPGSGRTRGPASRRAWRWPVTPAALPQSKTF